MAFKDSVKGGLSTCKEKIKSGCRTVGKGWKKSWDFLERKSAPLHKVYEVRDFKGFSAYGILFAILTIFFAIFSMSINMATMRIGVGATLFENVGEVFTIFALICLIIGILTTTDAGILFISAGYLFPFVGEFFNIIIELILGNFVPYMAANWIYITLYAIIAALYVLPFFGIIPVKWNRLFIPVASLIFIALGIMLISLGMPPFLTVAFGETKTGYGFCNFTDVTALCEYITYLFSVAFISVTIFGANDKTDKPITVVKYKDEAEEF